MVFEEEGWVKLLYRVWGWVMVVIVGVGMMSMVCVPANGAVICVPGDASTIQAGIDLAVDGDTVRIGSGVWRGDGNRDIDVKGKQIVIESEYGPESCIIDIQGSSSDLHTGFYFISNETELTILSGITITNGSGHLVDSIVHGGAVYIDNATPSIHNCLFVNNHLPQNTPGKGGAIYVFHGSLQITACEFIDNSCKLSGGAMHLMNASAQISECLFLRNSSQSSSGAIYAIQPDDIKILASHFEGNSAISGGAAKLLGDGILIDNCCFASNHSIEGGGALYLMSEGMPKINIISNSCFIINSTDELFGGALFAENYIVTNSMFIKNSGYTGGAVDLIGSSAVHNCLFDSNHSKKGAPVDIATSDSDVMRIVFSTFVNNRSDSGKSGGIRIRQMFSEIEITNCIFRNNYPSQIEPSSGDPDELPDVTYCNVEGGYRGYRNIDVDPLFCSDGPDRFFLSQIASGQSQDSPCLNKGNTDASLACVPESDPPICMDAFTTRTDRITDAGTVDMGFHYSPDWTGSTITGVRLWMPETVYHPGDPCACKVFVYNRDEQPLDGHALFVVLDILGVYYFAPSFTEYDSYLDDYSSFPVGRTEISVIPEFVWPTGAGSFSGAMFYAAMLDPTLTQVVGNWDWFQFGWGE